MNRAKVKVKFKANLNKKYNIKHRTLQKITKVKSNQKNRSKSNIKESGKTAK